MVSYNLTRTVVETWETKKKYWGCEWCLGSRNVTYTSILHGYGHTKPQRFKGYDFELSGWRDVIGHVTVGLAICGFLLVVNCNNTSILHGYGDIKPQLWSRPCAFGVTWHHRSRDRWTRRMRFPTC